MKIVYDSRTGLGKQFAQGLGYSCQSVDETLDTMCILVTRNVGLGKIPKTTKQFIKDYSHLIKGIVVNGNKRYGRFYCGAGKQIEAEYGLSVIRRIEGSGTPADALFVKEFIKKAAE